MLCAADRALLTATAARRVGVRRLRRLRLLLDPPARRLPPARRRTAENAAAMALDAGLDVELPATDCYGAPLLAALESGLVDERHARRGGAAASCARSSSSACSSEPYVDAARGRARRGHATAPRRSRATIARKSLVLLKNDGVLPLAAEHAIDRGDRAERRRGAQPVRRLRLPRARRVAARRARQRRQRPVDSRRRGGRGRRRPRPQAPSVLDALRERFGDRVAFARGLRRDRRLDATGSRRQSSWPRAVRRRGPRDGRQVRARPRTARAASSATAPRSTCPGVQEELVRAVVATGTPVVLVLVAGPAVRRASGLHEHCAAVLMAWLPGEEGAARDRRRPRRATSNPGGKLPISYPRSVGQIPVFYASQGLGRPVATGRATTSTCLASPLYPFGSRAQLHDVRALRRARPRADGRALGRRDRRRRRRSPTRATRAGDEVVQLYVRDPQASVTRPVLELKSFVRVELDAGRVDDDHVPRAGRAARLLRPRAHVRRRAGRDSRSSSGAPSADLIAAGLGDRRRRPRASAAEGVRRVGLDAPEDERSTGRSEVVPRRTVAAVLRRQPRARHEGLPRRRQGGRRRQPRDRRR